MAKVVVFFADDLEEIEALTPVDLLRRAGNEVTTVSVMGRARVVGSHGVALEADTIFEEAEMEEADLYVLPGGSGFRHYRANERLKALLTEKERKGKRIAAICAAPAVLGDIGLLEGKEATIYPGMEEFLQGGIYRDVPYVTDGRITTGHGPGAAMDFALELVGLLNGEGAKEELRAQLVYPYRAE